MANCQASMGLEGGTLEIEVWTGEVNGSVKCDMPLSEDQIFHFVDISNKRPIDCMIEEAKGSSESNPAQVQFKNCSKNDHGKQRPGSHCLVTNFKMAMIRKGYEK